MSEPSNPTSGTPSSRSLAPRPTSAQREAAEERLRRAAGEGLLTLEEYGDRVALVLAANTADELRAVTADLPATGAAFQEQTVVVRRRERPAQRWLVAVMGGHEERGRWRPAQNTNAIAFMGGVEVDLREAEVDQDELNLNALAVMGGIEIVVPDEVEVEMTGFALMGGRENTTRRPASDAAPLLRIRAFALMGGVEVRNPNEKERRESEQRGGSTALAQSPRWRSDTTRPLPARRSGGLPAPIRSLLGFGAATALVLGLAAGPAAVFGADATAVMSSREYAPTSLERTGSDEVEVRALMGSVQVIVPENHRVVLQGGGAIMGSVEGVAEVNQGLGEDAPEIVVRASSLMGSIEFVREGQMAERAALERQIDQLEDAARDADGAAEEAIEAQIDRLEGELDDLGG